MIRGTELLVTPRQLTDLYGCPFIRAANFATHLNAAMWSAGIVTPERIRMFLSQVGHESGRLRYVREIWGPTPAQLRYEGRKDLGNTEPGDGQRFLGRGLIQITGRANYQAVSNSLEQDFVTYPALLEGHEWASLSAAWFWDVKRLNKLADAGDFEGVTRRINGGLNGFDDRKALYEAAQSIIV